MNDAEKNEIKIKEKFIHCLDLLSFEKLSYTNKLLLGSNEKLDIENLLQNKNY